MLGSYHHIPKISATWVSESSPAREAWELTGTRHAGRGLPPWGGHGPHLPNTGGDKCRTAVPAYFFQRQDLRGFSVGEGRAHPALSPVPSALAPSPPATLPSESRRPPSR